MTVIVPAPVVKTVTVPCQPDRAFRLFTEGMGTWWLRSHSVAKSGQDKLVIEPRTGGAWYEIGRDGERCDWGRVLAWEPPARLVLDWQLSEVFAYDPGLHTEVEVTFTAAGPGTEVRLEHRMLENYGPAAGRMAQVFDSPDGWGGLLAAYLAAA
jgi:uncharacterized protein YndB with AHSA1/START domain